MTLLTDILNSSSILNLFSGMPEVSISLIETSVQLMAIMVINGGITVNKFSDTSELITDDRYIIHEHIHATNKLKDTGEQIERYKGTN